MLKKLLLGLMVLATACTTPTPSDASTKYYGSIKNSTSICRRPNGRFVRCPVPSPVPIPPPPDAPPPPPPPPPPAYPVVSPNGLSGETTIARNFSGTGGLTPIEGLAPVITNPLEGAFRMFCMAGQLLRDDPIVYPGQPGVSHLHQFFGNTGTNASSTYNSLRTTGGSTCGQSSTPFNRSAYWFPAMLDGVGNVIKPYKIKLYYKRNSNIDPHCSLAGPEPMAQACVDLPNGIRFVFGYNMTTHEGFANSNTVFYSCSDPASGNAIPGTGRYWNLEDLSATGCPVGADVVIVANSPICWDGVNLDTATHRSHMAPDAGPYYGNEQWRACVGAGAVAGHPYMISNMELLIYFTVDAHLSTWSLSSDAMIPGAKRGETFHTDYWEAWDPEIKARWHAGCINSHLSCGGAALENAFGGGIGQAIVGGDEPWPNGFPHPAPVPLTSIP